MDQLALSLIAPILGALLYGWLHERPLRMALLDRFMYLAVPALIAWQVLPHAWAEFGILSIGVLLLGLCVPTLIEYFSRSLAPHMDDMALLGGLSGLLLHALLEGAALAAPGAGVSTAVFLHRIPIGLMIWWVVRPLHGFWNAALSIGMFLAVTVVGYAVGARLVEGGQEGMELYQAFVGGALLHTVFHKGRLSHRH